MTKTKTKELKTRARIMLTGQHAFFAMVTLLVTICDVILGSIADYAFPSTGGTLNQILYWASSVLTNMVTYLILAGVIKIYLNLCRKRKLTFSDLWSAFLKHPEPIAAYSVIQFILQTILYSGGFWVIPMLFHTNNQRTAVQIIAASIAALVIIIFLQLSLSMVLFLYCDNPYLSLRELIRESWKMMSGNRLRLFFLQLSFLGVLLLCILSFGIGLLFIRPYLYTTLGLFYLDIRSSLPEES